MVVAMALLKPAGYVVLEARTAEEGIAVARTETPDLILMDISLPAMDGLTATRILKDDPQTKHIPIVALTAHAMRGDEKRSRPVAAATSPNPLTQGYPPKHILVVDDEPNNLVVLKALVTTLGYECELAHDGFEALSRTEPGIDLGSPGRDDARYGWV